MKKAVPVTGEVGQPEPPFHRAGAGPPVDKGGGVVLTSSTQTNNCPLRRVPDSWSDPVLYFHAVRAGRSPSPWANSLRRSWDGRRAAAARIERDAVAALPAIPNRAPATGTAHPWHRQRLRPGGDRQQQRGEEGSELHAGVDCSPPLIMSTECGTERGWQKLTLRLVPANPPQAPRARARTNT